MNQSDGASRLAAPLRTDIMAAAVELFARPILPGALVGSVCVTLPNGRTIHLGKPGAQPQAELRLANFKPISAAMRGASIGFAESYIAGDVDTPDPVALIRFFIQNREKLMGNPISRAMFKVRIGDKLRHRRNRNTITQSRANISAHYDLGNAFYAAWLDPGMTYSSALFSSPSTSLGEAQDAKYQLILDTLKPGAGAHILELGCGWGGFAAHAAKRSDVAVTGITLSREQLDFCRNREIGPNASFQLLDYRHTQGQYDGIASIEMIEAVGEEHWREYFQILHDRLKPGASAAIQAITIGEDQFDAYRRKVDFIQKYIFPGGMLPTQTVLMHEARKAGLSFETVRTFGPSYARTLSSWRKKFEDNWNTIETPGFDMPFRRMWRYYLGYCEAGFEEGVIDVGVYRFTRPHN